MLLSGYCFISGHVTNDIANTDSCCWEDIALYRAMLLMILLMPCCWAGIALYRAMLLMILLIPCCRAGIALYRAMLLMILLIPCCWAGIALYRAMLLMILLIPCCWAGIALYRAMLLMTLLILIHVAEMILFILGHVTNDIANTDPCCWDDIALYRAMLLMILLILIHVAEQICIYVGPCYWYCLNWSMLLNRYCLILGHATYDIANTDPCRWPGIALYRAMLLMILLILIHVAEQVLLYIGQCY